MSFRSIAAEIIKQRPKEPYAHIAREIGCSRETVRQVARRMKMPARNPLCANRTSESDLAEFKRLYDAGCKDAEISRQTGWTPSTILRWRERSNRPAHHDGWELFTDDQRKRSVALVAIGYSYGQAAAELGMTRNAVAGAVNRARSAKR